MWQHSESSYWDERGGEGGGDGLCVCCECLDRCDEDEAHECQECFGAVCPDCRSIHDCLTDVMDETQRGAA